MSITARSLQCGHGCRQQLRRAVAGRACFNHRQIVKEELTTSSAAAKRSYVEAMSQPAQKTNTEKQPFLTDIKEIRRRAREHILKGAVTEGYRGDRETVVRLLNEALA